VTYKCTSVILILQDNVQVKDSYQHSSPWQKITLQTMFIFCLLLVVSNVFKIFNVKSNF